MENATLDDFVALNDQLAALAGAGVPVDTGLESQGGDMAEILGKINAAVAYRVAHGTPVGDALDDAQQFVPASYRCLVQLGLRSGDLTVALNGSRQLSEFVDDSRYSVCAALFYPLLVCGLAYVGLIGFCLFLVPTLTDLVDSLRVLPGPALHVLQLLGGSMAYWIAIPPAVLLAIVAWWRHVARRRVTSVGDLGRLPAWLPGMSRAESQQRWANLAAALAALLEAGMPVDEALPLAAGASGDAKLEHGALELAASLKRGRAVADDDPEAKCFPPFLRWALLRSDATVGRVRALQMAAAVYRDSALRRAERLRIAAPMVACVVLGGTATLLYGLALFLPVVELLESIALPQG